MITNYIYKIYLQTIIKQQEHFNTVIYHSIPIATVTLAFPRAQLKIPLLLMKEATNHSYLVAQA
jgi:hypothetical protein